ncbi:hypothetical protein [Tenacibaculum sp.]|uniref:hypothetical protein n=1 Tax=Tenacibaculum sp. TaxID=1906242 RepID=UPI003D0E34CE
METTKLEFKGTKSEWKSIHINGVESTVIADTNKIAETYFGCESKTEEAEANAKLIAAAPETVKRLQKSTDHLIAILNESKLDPAR